MRKGVPKRFFLIPVFYVLVIAALVYLHFSQTRPFREDLGSISISGTTSSSGIADLSIQIHSIAFVFSPRTPLRLTAHGAERDLDLQSYESFYDGLEVYFESGLRMDVKYGQETAGAVVVAFAIEADVEEPLSISIPFEVKRGTVQTADGVPVVAIRDTSEQCVISFSEASDIDLERRRFAVSHLPGQEGYGIRIEKDLGQAENLYLYWFDKQFAGISGEDYAGQVNGYVTQAYGGWVGGRLAKDGRSWVSRDGQPLFEERIAAAMVSESLTRDDYRRAITVCTRAIDRLRQLDPTALIPVLTSPFVGGVEGYMHQLRANDLELKAEITAQIGTGDPNVFLTENLVQFIIDRIAGPFALTDELRKMTDALDYQNLSLEVCVGAVDAMLDIAALVDRAPECTQICWEIFEQRILPSISSVEDSLLMMYEDTRVDVLLTLQTGILTMKISEQLSDDRLAVLGRRLVLSALSLADSYGVLPRLLHVADRRIQSREGSLPPEQIYEMIALQNYYPHYVSLYPFLQPGAWIWTAAKVEQIDFSEDEHTIILRYPKNHYHYLVVQGVDRFKEIKLHDRTWKSDPKYSLYTDGWVYVPETRTLYIKLTHWSDSEAVVLLY